MKTRNKAILTAVCAVLLVVMSVMGTMAYLTDNDKVVNTFTVGKVDIKLDEADVDVNGNRLNAEGKVYVEGGEVALAERVKANEYHLLPGHTYTKDPMVTVLKDSEACFVRMFVVVTDYADAKATFHKDLAGDVLLLQNFVNWDQTKWSFKEVTMDANANTATYEFRYIGTLANTKATDADVELEKLFTEFTVPGYVDNAGLAKLAEVKDAEGKITEPGFAIKVYAQAMQADGFESNEAGAWTAAGMPQFN